MRCMATRQHVDAAGDSKSAGADDYRVPIYKIFNAGASRKRQAKYSHPTHKRHAEQPHAELRAQTCLASGLRTYKPR
jgi:hypothetical protein